MNFLGSLPKSDGRLNLIVMTEYTDVKKNLLGFQIYFFINLVKNARY